METISKGRNLQCNDSQGGLNTLYLFPYKKYNRSEIIVVNERLVSFPITQVFEWQFNGDFEYTQEQQENEGGKFYEQSLTVSFNGFQDIIEASKMLKKDYRSIVKDRNGKYFIFGLYNGIICDSLNKTTGDSKSSFNGFSLSFTATEQYSSPFINNLEDAGFVEVIDVNYLLLETGDYLLKEDNGKIILQP